MPPYDLVTCDNMVSFLSVSMTYYHYNDTTYKFIDLLGAGTYGPRNTYPTNHMYLHVGQASHINDITISICTVVTHGHGNTNNHKLNTSYPTCGMASRPHDIMWHHNITRIVHTLGRIGVFTSNFYTKSCQKNHQKLIGVIRNSIVNSSTLEVIEGYKHFASCFIS